ncbi:23S rRNA (uracil(1939)-C(5))-methyltransferase RlmD [Geobacter pickeringii]|uniref:RNA methyltransferase n=1 Tax=Geobacter pickeringii TaxID=345632 RepID=A0A0B5BE74_9BACT|nr:23S rRNA (uracil(1939)-C(5))-methyltransferase RlmD [Geobacter pickeringii]AJE03449.1 RNA methyltransferase [Geobacter pickeringii]
MKKTVRSRKEEKPAKQLKKGDIIDVSVSGLNEDGLTTATHEGIRLFVSGALPGEGVRVRITHAGRREMTGEVINVLQPSAERLAEPPCRRAGFCDGCPLIAMQYPSQLAWKRSYVEQTLHARRSLKQVPVHAVLPSPRPLHYRNSAKLAVAGTFRSPVVGIYRRNSHDVLDIDDCPLHHPLINRIVAAVKEGIKKGKVPVYSPRTGSGILRYLVIRVSERHERAMVVFVTARRSFNEIHHLTKHLRQTVPEVEVAVQNVNASEGNVILGHHDHYISKDHAIIEELGDIRFSISPRSFFQINSGSARIIYDKVREWSALSGNESVVDLYCGIGGISLYLAGQAREVHGIEFVDAAVADAEKNARLNRIDNCTFEAGDAAELLEELHEEGTPIDLLVLNPPRKGCDRRVLETAAAIGSQKIIYVSCSPLTLARDLEILAELGYRTREVQPVDMFPQTPHIESVALIVKEPLEQGKTRTPRPRTTSSTTPHRKKKGAA